MIEEQSTKEAFSEFTVADPPSASVNERLLQDMILQAESLPAKTDPKGRTFNAMVSIVETLSGLHDVDTYNDYFNVLYSDKVCIAHVLCYVSR